MVKKIYEEINKKATDGDGFFKLSQIHRQVIPVEVVPVLGGHGQ